MRKLTAIVYVAVLGALLGSCTYDKAKLPADESKHAPTPYNIDSAIPPHFPPMYIPADNPITKEGVYLGRKLFYDPILSGDNTLACAGCHQQEFGFADGGKRFSTGIHGGETGRNSMGLFNVGFGREFFWDGRAASLEEQALMPIQDAIEMDETLPNLVSELQTHPDYPDLFFNAFGTKTVTPELIGKAIAQFERTLISGNSDYDKHVLGQGFMSDDAIDGYLLVTDLLGADCFHCHSDGNQLWGNFNSTNPSNNFQNNGIDSTLSHFGFPDLGRGAVISDSNQNGWFKTASLRNIEVTGPFMHDGRFSTLEEVVDHYSDSLKWSPTVHVAQLEYVAQKGVQLTQEEKDDVIEFLKALTDTSALNNPEFGPP